MYEYNILRFNLHRKSIVQYCYSSVTVLVKNWGLILEQGTDSVSVYAQKFDTYARYAPEYVSNEADRIWKFCEGLKVRIRPYMVSTRGRTYAKVVEQALV